MNEKLFQFIWEYALFDSTNLYLKDGRPVTIIHQGSINNDAGPDFTNARIKINETTWAGNIELHLKESDWRKHGHHENSQYQNIILHVVLDADSPTDHGNFPVLSLKHKIRPELAESYTRLMNQQNPISCSAHALPQIPQLIWAQWTDRLLSERWDQKIHPLQSSLQQSTQDWSHLLYRQLARYFGAKTNTGAFIELTEHVPFSILSRHRENLSHLEAILFGQAGLLPHEPEDPYSIELSVHYAFYKRKYGLIPMQGHQWKFLRMRPAHFPTIRIAQFAMLIHKSTQFFEQLIAANPAREESYKVLFKVHTSAYWQEHYVFGKPSVSNRKSLGSNMAHNILINVIIPIRILYAREMGREAPLEDMTALLCDLPPEENKIIKQWKEAGIKAKDAYTSQALLQLYEQYCTPKRCLDCSIGLYILKR